MRKLIAQVMLAFVEPASSSYIGLEVNSDEMKPKKVR